MIGAKHEGMKLVGHQIPCHTMALQRSTLEDVSATLGIGNRDDKVRVRSQVPVVEEASVVKDISPYRIHVQ